MRYVAFCVVMACCGPVFADKKPADATGTAVEVVKAGIKATGGEELLNKLKCSTTKVKGEMSMMGIDLEFTADMTYAPPDKYKMNMSASFGGQKIKMDQVMNGKKLKSTMNGQAMPLDDDTTDNIRENMAEHEIGRLTPLLDEKVYKIKLGDEAEVDGKKAAVVIVTGGELKDKEAKLFFDKTTNLLVKMQRKSKAPGGGGEVDEEMFFTDYKKVQDVMTAHKYTVKHDGKDFMKMSVTEAKLMEKIDDKEFAVDD